MKILLLGGHGFVGKNVNEVLHKSTYEIVSLSRRSGLDLTDYDLTKRYLSRINPDVIINCAAHGGSVHYVTEYAADVIDDNIQMILNLYRAVKNVCPSAKIINPISNCSYPGDAEIQIESEWLNGAVHKSVKSYGNSRRVYIAVSECYAMQYGIQTINFIVPNSYGPGDYTDPNKTHALNGMIIRMLQAKRDGNSDFEIWGTGKPEREWIFVKDVANMLASVVETEKSQEEPVNIAQSRSYSIRETAEMIKELTNYNGKLIFNTAYQDGAPVKRLDDTLFREKYPNFIFTDIRKGIEETIDYYQKALKI